jgi:hypothetical protein
VFVPSVTVGLVMATLGVDRKNASASNSSPLAVRADVPHPGSERRIRDGGRTRLVTSSVKRSNFVATILLLPTVSFAKAHHKLPA